MFHSIYNTTKVDPVKEKEINQMIIEQQYIIIDQLHENEHSFSMIFQQNRGLISIDESRDEESLQIIIQKPKSINYKLSLNECVKEYDAENKPFLNKDKHRLNVKEVILE